MHAPHLRTILTHPPNACTRGRSCRWQARSSMGYALYYLVQLTVQGSVYMKDAWHRVRRRQQAGSHESAPGEGGIALAAERRGLRFPH